jgi:hypothetical protein
LIAIKKYSTNLSLLYIVREREGYAGMNDYEFLDSREKRRREREAPSTIWKSWGTESRDMHMTCM